MMASTHTSTSCSPTVLDLPFAYSSYNNEQESSNSNYAENGNATDNINCDTGNFDSDRNTSGSKSHTHHSNLDPKSNHIENSLRFDYNPNYYSSPPKKISNHQNHAPDSISFTPSNILQDTRALHDDEYSGFVTVSESDQRKNALYLNKSNNINPINHSNRNLSTLHSTADSQIKQQVQDGIDQETNPKKSYVNEPSILIGADSYRYGPDILSHLLDADSLNVDGGAQTHFIGNCESAHKAAKEASDALQNGEFEKALQLYTFSAKAYRDVALDVQDLDASLFNSLLLLSQAQARNGTSLLALHKANTIQLEHLPQHYPNQSDDTSKSLDGETNEESKIIYNGVSNESPDTPNDDLDKKPGTSNVSSASSTKSKTQSSLHKNSTSSSTSASSDQPNSPHQSLSKRVSISNEEKIRATIRGALSHKKEADITDSTFLGMAASKSNATTGSKSVRSEMNENVSSTIEKGSENLMKSISLETKESSMKAKDMNPVDDLMKLEKELKDMNMAVQLGNSVSSLNLSRSSTSRLKQSFMDDGSFCVVRPGSGSATMGSRITSASNPLSTSQNRPYSGSNDNYEAGIRARANRLHPFVKNEVNSTKSHLMSQPVNIFPKQNHDDVSLDASWWGNSSINSSSSSIANSIVSNMHAHSNLQPEPLQSNHSATNTKQVMRLLDSLKTLGDENAALLREVEEARVSRLEAKTAREHMKSFKAEYGKRFSRLKAALDKVRKEDNVSGHKEESPLKSR